MERIVLNLTFRKDSNKFHYVPPKKPIPPKLILTKLTTLPIYSDEENWEDEQFFGSAIPSKLDKIMANANQPNLTVDPFAFLPPIHELKVLDSLSATQIKALQLMVNNAKQQSDKCLYQILKLCHNKKEDYRKLLLYIRDQAPIIIHVRPDTISKYMHDDHYYRNKFEIYATSPPHFIGRRFEWESRMFGQVYDKSPPDERVKYGVLNMLNDPYGVKACYGYGDCYFLLKNVRMRTSFADQDTASSVARIASCENYAHVLSTYNPAEFKATLEVALGEKTHHDSSIISIYKEVQIHGKVNLKEHVEALVLQPHYRTKKYEALLYQLKIIAKKHNFRIIWMDWGTGALSP